jgi:hypothetical protein
MCITMKSQLERAISLAARTGDKIIVIDELNDHSSVVMNLDDYEKLLNSQNKGSRKISSLTEEEMLDKINDDIISWKDANEARKFFSEIDLEDDEEFDDETGEDNIFSDKAEDKFYFKDELSTEDEEEFEDDDEDYDFVPPHFDAEGKIISEAAVEPSAKTELKEKESVASSSIVDEPTVTPIVSDVAESAADKTLSEEVIPTEAENNINEESEDVEEAAEEPETESEPEAAAEELIPEEPVAAEPLVAKAIAEEASAAKVAVEEPIASAIEEAPAEADQDVYYYHEPEPEKSETEKATGFTSLKDELKKSRQAWAIPEEVKKSAEDVKI